MTNTIKKLLSANGEYAAKWDRTLTMLPRRRMAVLTCMDARIDPLELLGLKVGDCHIIRNAGGRASDDAIRSLVVSYKLLKTRLWLVIHHTDCGMELVDDATFRTLLAASLEPAEYDKASGWRDTGHVHGSRAAEYMTFLTIADHARSLTDDVLRLRTHPLVPKDIEIHGMMFDTATGRLTEMGEADLATGMLKAA